MGAHHRAKKRVSDADVRPLDADVPEDEANVEWSDAPDFTIPSKEGDDVPTTPERWYEYLKDAVDHISRIFYPNIKKDIDLR